MNKRTIQSGSCLIEFADLESAEQFAIENGISLDQIGQIEDTTGSIGTDDVFYRSIANGFPVPNTTCSLALYDEDRATFSSMLTLINEALALGQMTTSSQVSIKCADGDILYMSAIEFKILMLQYGFYYKTHWDQKNFS